nr:Urease accessory protein like [Ipomoea batatas]GMD99516.1 Urease accessory protein like [Ipomoea batatas]GME03306.1 Urease accessory protein like [Ipomoea batatas]
MCYEVQCSTCGKTSWGGCGRHVPSVYQRIPDGQHCQCKGWPGVKTGAAGENNSGAGAGAEEAKASSSCSIL